MQQKACLKQGEQVQNLSACNVLLRSTHQGVEGEEGEGEAQEEGERDDGDIEAAGISACWCEEPVQHS